MTGKANNAFKRCKSIRTCEVIPVVIIREVLVNVKGQLSVGVAVQSWRRNITFLDVISQLFKQNKELR